VLTSKHHVCCHLVSPLSVFPWGSPWSNVSQNGNMAHHEDKWHRVKFLYCIKNPDVYQGLTMFTIYLLLSKNLFQAKNSKPHWGHVFWDWMKISDSWLDHVVFCYLT
jgi:hypothetical protein